MADPTETAQAAAPPKKRSFFKKAAWQTKPQAESEKDLFSHTNEFKDIVAEENRRKQEEKRRKEVEKKRKADDEYARKRRRVSEEPEDLKLPVGRSGSSTHSSRKEGKARSATPNSPLSAISSSTSFGAHLDLPPELRSPTRVTRSTRHKAPQAPQIIDLGDSDNDDLAGSLYPTSSATIAQLPSKPAPSDDLEEIEDPELARLKARARARAAAGSPSEASGSTIVGKPPKEAVVEVLITTEIPNANPLKVKIKTSSTLEKLRLAWCGKQGFSDEMTRHVFLTWKNTKVYDSTTVLRLGIKIDDSGVITVDGTSDLYDEDNPPRIHLAAWTEEIRRQWQKEEAERVAAEKKAAEIPEPVEEEPPVAEPTQQEKIKLFLKVKGKPDWKIAVNSHTTIAHLTAGFKHANNIPEDQPVTLMFDGDRLSPMDTIAEAEIEDMTAIEVYMK